MQLTSDFVSYHEHLLSSLYHNPRKLRDSLRRCSPTRQSLDTPFTRPFLNAAAITQPSRGGKEAARQAVYAGRSIRAEDYNVNNNRLFHSGRHSSMRRSHCHAFFRDGQDSITITRRAASKTRCASVIQGSAPRCERNIQERGHERTAERVELRGKNNRSRFSACTDRACSTSTK